MVWLERLVRRRTLVVALYAVFTAALAPGLGRLAIDNSPEGFFVSDDRALSLFRQSEQDFGRDRELRVVLWGKGLWSAESLRWQVELERAVTDLRGVFGALGFGGHRSWLSDSWPPEDVATLRRAAVSDALDRGAGWVGDKGEPITILVALYALSTEQQDETLRQIEALLAGAPPGVEARLVGLPVLQRALDAEVVRVSRRFFPALALLACAALMLVLRAARHVAAPLMLVAAVEIGVLGSMGYLGVPLGTVNIVVVPLLMVLTLATAVHVLMHYRAELRRGRPPVEAVTATLEAKAWPVLWTGITTCAGFGSLASSGVPPVRALGLWSALGIAYATFAVVTLLPALMVGSTHRPGAGTRASPWERWLTAAGAWLAGGAARRRGLTVGLFGALAVIAAVGCARLRLETGILSYLSPRHPVRQDVERLERHGVGAAAADLIVELPEGGVASHGAVEEEVASWRSRAGLDALRVLGSELRGLPGVLGAISLFDLADADMRAHHPEATASDGQGADGEIEALARVGSTEGGARLLSNLVSADGRRARIPLQVALRGFDVLEPVLEKARGSVQRALPEARSWLTGRYLLVLAAQRSLLRTMVVSLSLTMLCVTGVFALVLRGGRLLPVALVPNLWPVLWVLGLMGWVGVPIDSTTVMIAAVVLGLAVDDTLHTLGYMRRGSAVSSRSESAVAAVRRAAPAHVLTSCFMAAGFGVFALSAFVPVSRFGALIALAIVAALLADLLLFPALVALTGERRKAG